VSYRPKFLTTRTYYTRKSELDKGLAIRYNESNKSPGGFLKKDQIYEQNRYFSKRG